MSDPQGDRGAEADPETVTEIEPDPEEVDAGPDPGERRLSAPHTERTPEDVLKVVLDGLRSNDDPHEDAGLRTAFNFASPRFRTRVGGSLEEFVQELTDPINGPLVDHNEARRGRLEIDGGDATERVVITGPGGDTNTYEFHLRKVEQGKYAGCWMLDAVDLVCVGAAPDHQYMPMVSFDGTDIKCKQDETLRDVLLRASGVSPYNSAAEVVNCGGNGLCGTCAVEVVDGEVTEPTAQESRRMKLPPLRGVDDDLRLSCQCQVQSDLEIHKHEGIWGQHISGTDAGTGEPIWISDEEYLGEADVNADVETESRTDDDLDVSDDVIDMFEQAADEIDDDDDDGDDVRRL